MLSKTIKPPGEQRPYNQIIIKPIQVIKEHETAATFKTQKVNTSADRYKQCWKETLEHIGKFDSHDLLDFVPGIPIYVCIPIKDQIGICQVCFAYF